jgi:hypothetical protein
VAKLCKVKRPGGTYTFEVQPVREDAFGVWLFAPTGSPWQAPDDEGRLPVDVLVLLNPEQPWIAWWVDDPVDRRLEIDVCLPPAPVADGWSFVDLELDPKRHANGHIEVEDHDEFDDARRAGWINDADAALALATASRIEADLRAYTEPFGHDGWERLAQLQLGSP